MASATSAATVDSKDEQRRGRAAGRLVGVTATGPVYLGERRYVPLPLGAALATAQELARKVDKHDARVTSSLAVRVSGEEAYEAWLSFIMQCSAQVAALSPRARLGFLHFFLAYVHRVGRVDGLEPLLMTAVNAAWPWLSNESTDLTLRLAGALLRKSEFARKHVVPVVDPTTRTAGLFGPGAAAKLSLDEWRTSRSLLGDGLGGLPTDVGDKLGEIAKSPLEKAIDQMFGGDSSSLDDAGSLLAGPDNPGVPGGLPSVGDLPGRHGDAPKGGVKSLDDIAAGLMGGNKATGIPGGLPDVSSIPGAKGQPPSASSSRDSGAGLLGSLLGYGDYRGVSGFLRQHGSSGFKTGIFEGATPGGPFAPPGQLGIGGSDAESPDETIANGLYGASMVALAVVLAPAAVEAAPVTVAVVAGAAMFYAGWLIGTGLAEKYKKPDKPEPPKTEPHDGDLYPDPMGAGGGNPTQLPAFDGGGAGNPTTLPGEDGEGGGTPNTIWGKTTQGASIWDDNFGGPGPTVRPQMLTAPALVGPGLMVDFVQVGRTTLRY